LGWSQAGGKTVILTGLANYEDGQEKGAAVSQYQWASNSVSELVPAGTSSVGPIPSGDIDADGDLDLFVGGRVIPGRWPEAASSQIFRNEGQQFVLDGANSKGLEQVGLVSGAVFSDLDGDGLPELVLACEWGPIRVFRNRAGRLEEATKELGFTKYNGWWNGVMAGDLDADGRLDIIASNWGLNSPYRATVEHPQQVHYGDLGGLGAVDVVEAEFEPEIQAVAPRRYRDALTPSLPFIAGKFPTHKAYSEASLEAVLGEARSRARVVEASTLASTVFSTGEVTLKPNRCRRKRSMRRRSVWWWPILTAMGMRMSS
jgi:hypothetical protein